MAPPKKQKREYNTGDAVWVKVKGWPTWPGLVEDVKNVTNDSVIKRKRKNAILVKFLESENYWASHDEINPFQKETFDDFLISANHKNFNAWKKAFKLVAEEAKIDNSVIEETFTKANSFKPSPSPKKRKERENEETTTPKRRKSSSASPSPKRTARHASTGGDKKKGTPKKAAAPKKNLLKPTLESTESLLNELNSLLVKYNTDKEDDKVYQLLKIISNFSIADHAILFTVSIGDTIKKLSTEGDHIANIPKIAIKITEYYDSLKKVEEKEEKEEEKEENKEEEEKKEENGEAKTESTEEKKEGEDIVITENTEVKADDKMETEKPAESEAKPEETTITA